MELQLDDSTSSYTSFTNGSMRLVYLVFVILLLIFALTPTHYRWLPHVPMLEYRRENEKSRLLSVSCRQASALPLLRFFDT